MHELFLKMGDRTLYLSMHVSQIETSHISPLFDTSVFVFSRRIRAAQEFLKSLDKRSLPTLACQKGVNAKSLRKCLNQSNSFKLRSVIYKPFILLCFFFTAHVSGYMRLTPVAVLDCTKLFLYFSWGKKKAETDGLCSFTPPCVQHMRMPVRALFAV